MNQLELVGFVCTLMLENHFKTFECFLCYLGAIEESFSFFSF